MKKIKTFEYWYCCPICKKPFSFESSVRRHYGQKHKDEGYHNGSSMIWLKEIDQLKKKMEAENP